MIVRYCYSTRINLFRTRKLFGIDQLTRIHNPHVCRMSMTPQAWSFPPLDTLSGNHPELAVHLRMNFRSEQRASYYVSASIAFHLSCIAFVCYACFVFIVSPPLLLFGSPDDCCRCPCDRLLRRRPYPYRRASRQAVPLHLSHISPTFLYFSIALGICCYYVTIVF